MFKNDTVNQHYISQAEQRLNSLNRNAKKSNQRIYEFRVLHGESLSLELANQGGRRIEQAMSVDDLFSFDVARTLKVRSNLEAAFGEYEQDIARHSLELLRKIREGDALKTGPELIGLFTAKFLNFLRNPYSVTKVLNTVGAIDSFQPTDPTLNAAYQQVAKGSRPRQETICQRFGLTADTYERWLKALFLMLARDPRSPLNILEQLVKQMFESNHTIVQIFDYTQRVPWHVCLLSDRGFNIPLQEESEFAFQFNIASCAFVTYAFIDPRPRVEALVGVNINERQERIEQLLAMLRGQVKISVQTDDLGQLARYNQLTAFQCASRVYAAHQEPLLQEP